MKVFVVNLKRSIERREDVVRQLNKIGLNYEFFEGIDGEALCDDEIDNVLDKKNPYFRPFKKGEIGCFLSHYNLLKKIVDDGFPHAIVLEDDIIFSKNFSKVSKLVEEVIEDKDVILLYATINDPVNFKKVRRLDSVYSLYQTSSPLYGTVGFAIGNQAAKNLAENLLPINNVIDDWSHNAQINSLNLYILFPFILSPSSHYSEIHSDNINTARFFWMKRLIYKYKIFPFWQLMKEIRRKRFEKMSLKLIRVNGKKIKRKFL